MPSFQFISSQLLLAVLSGVDELLPFAQDNGLTIELSSDDSVVLTDPVLLNRILRNLVSNAIKFTAAGGVKIDIKSSTNSVSISVSDTGIGIPQSQQQHIFDEYYQLDNRARDRTKGIGLGLALVRRMCDLLQHSIQIKSIVGEGTCFTLTLPRGEESKVTVRQDELSADPIEHLHVLLIDDEQPILDAMSVMLSDWECYPRAFTSLQSAEQAIEIENYKPDLIISDYRLKDGITGLDAIRSLQSKFSEAIPALIISGDTDPELLESVHQQDYYLLHKPVKGIQLKKVIRILF